MNYRTTILVVFVLCFAGPRVAVAEESGNLHPWLESGFSLDLGVFYPDRELDLRVNGTVTTTAINDEFDFDKRSQLDSTDEIFAGEMSWRFRGNWSLVGQYFSSADTYRVALDEDIEWGDVVFGADTNAAVGFDFSLTRIFFGRQFNSSESHNVGIGGGIHWLRFGSSIEGTILINGTPSTARRAVSAEAPLPNIGAWYIYSISPRWALRTRLDLLSADIGDYDGLMLNVALGVNYQAFEHFGLGLNYNYFKLDVGIDKSDWRGDIETVYDGVYLYASYYY
jgi:hypothetical protein